MPRRFVIASVQTYEWWKVKIKLRKNQETKLTRHIIASVAFIENPCQMKSEIVAHKIDKLNNNFTPPPSPSVHRRSSHLWHNMMGVLRRKDSTAASSNAAAFANAINNNRISCPTGGMTTASAQRSPSLSILRHHRYYYSSEVSTKRENWKFKFYFLQISNINLIPH